ncbi:right-handed parallel beta-helix repeat-containing protein [Dokdonella soli]|uniref:DUF7452 domain-containing protein n=1 Tax=Dokdonella soli TaxID=529810 RepID=A0ABN1IZ48_9GAMM
MKHPVTTRARHARPAGLLVLAVLATQASALTWPNLSGIGPCQGTLQACIDSAVAGDTVQVGYDHLLLPDGYTAIDEDISIGKSLTLTAASGIDAVFAPGRTIVVNSPGSGATSVTLRNLVLRHAHVTINHFSDSASSYAVDGLRIIETDTPGNCAIRYYDFGSGAPQFTVGNSAIELNHSGVSACALFAQGNGGSWSGAFSGNRIHAANGSGSGTSLVQVLGSSAGTFRISANQISGGGYAGGIAVSQSAGSGANVWYVDDNYVSGERVAPLSGYAGILVQPRNSELHVVNNTVRDGTQGLWIMPPSATPDNTSGVVANNIVAFHSGFGLAINGGLAAVGEHNNLVFHNLGGDTTGPSTVVADPQFMGARNAHVYGSSPARDGGNSADVPAFTLDADGERRITGPSVDIGAFEYSLDRGFVHASQPADACCNSSLIQWQEFGDGVGGNETMLLTPHHGNGNPVQLAQNLGSWLVSDAAPPLWALFHENTGVAMQSGRAFSVFAPTYGYTHFVHTTTLANITANYTRLPTLDGGVSALAFVTHNYNPGFVGGTYHDHRVGLERVGGDWYIRNEDLADMPVGVSFNVVVAPVFASANAWQVIVPSATAGVALSHPLLDDNPCAAPQVTRVDNPFDPAVVLDDVPFALRYAAGYGGAPGHWSIVAEGSGSPAFPAGAGFNVMVPGAQAGACRDNDRIFADGFDP